MLQRQRREQRKPQHDAYCHDGERAPLRALRPALTPLQHDGKRQQPRNAGTRHGQEQWIKIPQRQPRCRQGSTKNYHTQYAV